MNTPAVKKAIEIEDTFLQDKIECRAYEQREKAIRDYYSYINAYKEEGLQEGLQEGIQEGIKKGIKKVAINLLKANMSIDFISQKYWIE